MRWNDDLQNEIKHQEQRYIDAISQNKPSHSARTKLFIITLTLLIIASIVTILCKDSMIIQLGITHYRTVRTTLFSLLGTVSIFASASTIHDKQKKQKPSKPQTPHVETTPSLSVSGELNPDAIGHIIARLPIKSDLLLRKRATVSRQLQDMNDYQARLDRLLQNNGADALSDTRDVLDQVEQYICKNVRKVLNYFEVLSETTSEAALTDAFDNCIEDNQTQLNQVQELLLALAEFLNNQGDNGNELASLELYKKTILNSLSQKPTKGNGL